jgi:hypothetical protein
MSPHGDRVRSRNIFRTNRAVSDYQTVRSIRGARDGGSDGSSLLATKASCIRPQAQQHLVYDTKSIKNGWRILAVSMLIISFYTACDKNTLLTRIGEDYEMPAPKSDSLHLNVQVTRIGPPHRVMSSRLWVSTEPHHEGLVLVLESLEARICISPSWIIPTMQNTLPHRKGVSNVISRTRPLAVPRVVLPIITLGTPPQASDPSH